MHLNRILKTGDEVRVLGASGSFITMVDDVTGEDTFTILTPYRGGELINVPAGEKFSVSCVTERGIYSFEATVTMVDESTLVRLLHLKITGEIHCNQRRDAYRVRESIQVNARKLSGGKEPDGKWVKTSTVDIAELGLLLKFNEYCEYGQDMEMSLRINHFGIREVIPKVRGKVVRCIPTKNREFGYLLGIQFVDLPEKARDILIKLVILSQRSKLTLNLTKGNK